MQSRNAAGKHSFGLAGFAQGRAHAWSASETAVSAISCLWTPRESRACASSAPPAVQLQLEALLGDRQVGDVVQAPCVVA